MNVNCQKFAPILYYNACVLARIGRLTDWHDLSQNGLKHVTDDWHDEFPTFISRVITATTVKWEIQHNNADWDCFATLSLQRDLEDSKSVVSFRDIAYLWDKILRVTRKARGVQETLKCGPGMKEMNNPEGGLGKLRGHAKSRSEHQRPTQTR